MNIKLFIPVLVISIIIGGTFAFNSIVNTPKNETTETQNTVEITVTDIVENKDIVKEIPVNKNDISQIANMIIQEIGSKTTINSILQKENSIYIDFSSNSSILHTGTAEELAVLNSLANTFINNLNYDNIYFTVDKGIYESGHIILELNEPYTP